MEELEQMITTVDIAKMMGMSHKNILRKIEGRENEGKMKGDISKALLMFLTSTIWSPLNIL